jgi:hypothetical protein
MEDVVRDGQWYHVTTFENAHAILTQGIIAPTGDQYDPAKDRDRTWDEEDPLRSRNGYTYLANEKLKPVHEIARVLNDRRKIGTSNLVALRVNLTHIDRSRLAVDEDVIDNPESYLAYWQDFAEWLNSTKDANIRAQTVGDYEASAYDFMNSLVDNGAVDGVDEIWDEYAQENPRSEEMLHLYLNLLASIESGSIADKVDAEINPHDTAFVEMSLAQGLIAVEGNIHPDDTSLHPDYEIRYKLWKRGQDIEEVSSLPHAHIHPDQLSLDEGLGW